MTFARFKQKNPDTALIIFTRNPELGKCKTRLAKDIGDESALEVYLYLIKQCIRVIKNIEVDRYVFYSDKVILNDVWDDSLFHKSKQEGHMLGLRMQNAFGDLFKIGYQRVVIIGTDLPDLNEHHINQAFEALETHGYVIGPSKDGGYYLLGMKTNNDLLFKNKKWGESTVLKDTVKDIEGQTVYFLQELNDIDTFEDLKEHENILNLYVTKE